jgi:hypothetical protein
MKKALIIFTLIFSYFSNAQLTVLHVNSSWNVKHDIDLTGIENAKVQYVFLEDLNPSIKQQIKSVPTILILNENNLPKMVWSGGIALKLNITKDDVQSVIDKIIVRDYNIVATVKE